MRKGECLCGAVRFVAQEVDAEFGACHCKQCQRWTGSVFMSTEAPANSVEWTGLDFVETYSTSEWSERAWCRRCGSPLWFRGRTEDAPYEIPVGLFDETSGLRLTHEIFVDRKPEGFALAGDLERRTEAEMLALYRRERKAEP